ncbi:hypothetical protein BC830DRAFT_1168138 [Chytriomyces sp. MP71]|nr:hypothetical protein BC830DRAFT_1168138 [Chytriomyces sp. MP71]
MSTQSASIERFEIVGTGKNTKMLNDCLVCEAGWDVEGTLEAIVILKAGEKLKNVRIQAEFRGFMETMWETQGKPASREESDDYKVTRYGRVFQQIVTVVHDSNEPIMPNPIGGSSTFPFKFTLPKTNMPPSFKSPSGVIQYYVKCSMYFQESMKLLKSTFDYEIPVLVYMPEAPKITMLSAPSQMFHQSDKHPEKVSYSVEIQRRILTVGETLEVDITVLGTPEMSKLRYIHASLRSVISYVNPDAGIGVQTKFPRPLSEISIPFQNIQIGKGGSSSIKRRLYLSVDPDLAQASMESPFISIKSLFNLKLMLNDSETPNINYDVPIVVVPPTALQVKEAREAKFAAQQLAAQQQQMSGMLSTRGVSGNGLVQDGFYQAMTPRGDSLMSGLSSKYSEESTPASPMSHRPPSDTPPSPRHYIPPSETPPSPMHHRQVSDPFNMGMVRTDSGNSLLIRQQSVASLPAPTLPMNSPILSSTDRPGALYRNKSLPAHMMGGAPPRRDNIPGKHAVPSSPRNNRATFSVMLNELDALELTMELERPHGTPALPPAYVPMTRTSSQNHVPVVQSSSVLRNEFN